MLYISLLCDLFRCDLFRDRRPVRNVTVREAPGAFMRMAGHLQDDDVRGRRMMHLSRRSFVGLAALGAVATVAGRTVSIVHAAPVLDVYKSPYCGCCGAWVEHMRGASFQVRVTETEDLDPIKARLGVPPDLRSCHTAVIDGYVIEGHVPARDVTRLLADRPTAIGLAVPGMPIGSPGMEQGGQRDPYQVMLFSSSGRSVFARY